MRKIESLEEIQRIELEMLNFVDSVCKKKNIRYFLAGGTLLGAVRHKGFIPWDNDIDLAMPREDYIRFIHEIENNDYGKYRIHRIKDDNNYYYPFAKLVNEETVIIETSKEYKINDIGLFLDLFPLDGMPNDFAVAKKLLMRTCSRVGIIGRSNASVENMPIIKRCIKIIVNTYYRIVGRERCVFREEKKLKKYNFDSCQYIASTYGLRQEKEIIARECFSEYILMDFEGYSFRAPIGYDQYLTQMYGDYLRLPPEGKRVAPHDLEVFWKE